MYFGGVRTAECIDEFIRFKAAEYDAESLSSLSTQGPPQGSQGATALMPNGVKAKPGMLLLLLLMLLLLL